jgi:hypothetical protein
MDKSGMPMYQPVVSQALTHGLAINPYAQFAFPGGAGLQSYFPAVTCESF